MAADLWTLDTEDNSKGHVHIVNFYNGDEHFTFTDKDGGDPVKEAILWLISEPRDIQVWCVNLQYDLINLFRDSMDVLDITFVKGRIITARILDTKIYFKDTLNHWKISVEEMGNRIGLKKIKTASFNNVTYCRRDTEITWKFVRTMQLHYEGIGAKLKSTIGSTALDYYYSHYGQRSKKMKNSHIEFCMKGYYGGRTEIFFNRPIEGSIFYFDCNSLYPTAMLEKFPTLTRPKFVKRPDFSKEGMVDVELSCRGLSVPYLPLRTDKGQLIFPIGHFRGVYTYFEIREAKKLGYKIKKILKALEFSSTIYPFTEFVNDCYAKRLEAQAVNDSMLSDCYKLLMNNLYGKFGQGREYQKLVPFNGRNKSNGDTVFQNLVLKNIDSGFPRHTNGVWACYTTAYARHILYQKLIEVEKQGGLLIYCDTDSVIFEHRTQIFKDSKLLGEMKKEGDFKYAHFKLPKLYSLVERGRLSRKIFRAKGVPRNVAEDFFNSGRASFKRPYKLKETLRRNLSPKRTVPLVANYWDLTTKEIRQKYDKRIVLKSGHTRPIELKQGGVKLK